MDFVSIDFETANRYRQSACSVGLAKFRDGKLVETFYSLLRPPSPFDKFDDFNIGIHGIQQHEVSEAQTLGQRWPEIETFIEGLPLVAHNASFDMSVLRRQLDHEGVDFKQIKFACTLLLSKHFLKLPVLKLPYVVESLGLSFGEHHNALDDAVGCGQVFQNLITKASADRGFLEEAGLGWGVISPGLYIGPQNEPGQFGARTVHHTSSDIRNYRAANGMGEIDTTAPLFGKIVAFTGELNSFTRDDARFAVELEGGSWVDKPNSKTHYLVIGGKVDLRKLRLGEGWTSKLEKAASLRERGSLIEIIDEASFLELLSPGSP